MPPKNNKPQILLTNDDGINSPGLWAAAEALSALGYVTVAAPREQSSGMGRSMPPSSDGLITPQSLTVHGEEWTVYAVGGTPAQTVQHAMFEVMPDRPDLVVAGINYGSNLATGVTISGTVGAAMEGSALGAPALAVSLETDHEYHLSYSEDIDFAPAAHFTALFAQKLLEQDFEDDVHLLKLEIPSDATIDTPWSLTRQARIPYYISTPPERESWDQPGSTGYKLHPDLSKFPEDSDVHAVLIKRQVAVTPLSLDLTSRVDFSALEKQLGED